MKTLMSDDVCRADWEISSLMCEFGGSDQTKPSNKFKLSGHNFDRLKFLYDHLIATKDVNKVKKIGRQKVTKNISSYMMRCVVLTRCLFKSSDDYEQNEIKLNQYINQLNEQQKMRTGKIYDMEKQLLEEKTKRKKIRG